jgi:hypothetical protein
MKEIRITIRCQSEPQKHAKIIRVKARLGVTKARELADLLDGTSFAYIHPPGENSPIGRCCQCQAPVDCAVSTVVDGKEVPPTCEEATEEKVHADKKAERKLAKDLSASACASSATKKTPKRIAHSAARSAVSTI